MMSRGNHETAIIRHHETDLTARLCERLRYETDHHIHPGSYAGWLRWSFLIDKTQRQTIPMYFFHGSGGGGPVTRGVIQTNRMAVWNANARICVTGHTHDAWIVPIEKVELNHMGNQIRWTQWHVKCGTYKD